MRMKSSRISSIPHNNKLPILLFLAALMLTAGVLSLGLGAVSIPPMDTIRILLGQQVGGANMQIILFARLPRTCGCLLAGMALAVSGAVIQAVLSNPMAAPNIIGVNAGAGLLVAVCGALMPQAIALIPVCAFAGALLGVLLVLFISERTGASRLTLILAGMAVSSIFSAGIDAVLTFVPDALLGYTDFRIGSLTNLTMARITPAFWVIAVAFLLILTLAGELDILMLGSEVSQSLGLRVKPLRLLLLALAAALAGAAVSFTGLLGFVGLIVPHIMRRFLGEESAPLLIGSALGGATALTACDILARTLFAPYELPVGIVLSLLGGPFFIFLLLKQRGGRTHD